MKIKLSSTVSIDLDTLIKSRLLINANSGGGKSHTIRRILEQSHGKVQQIIIDSEGEFSTLREKFDYVLIGKGGDGIPADPRSAGLLARKLLELGVSAIIDLYELPPQERKHFVRVFLDAMVNSPKELWHQCLVIVDEAHVFAPEKGESEASSAVIDLATRGRKRGFCVVLATQRISKLAKDAAAECNNKLVGRSSQDIDMKRSGEELGFTTKEQFTSLRQLEPGEFYCFGPAISNDVVKTKILEVQTSHPEIGTQGVKIAAPTPSIKKILGQLGDLPKEAQEEAKTISEFKAQVKDLNYKLSQALAVKNKQSVKVERIQVPVVGKKALAQLLKTEANMKKMVRDIREAGDVISEQGKNFEGTLIKLSLEIQKVTHPPIEIVNKPISKEEINAISKNGYTGELKGFVVGDKDVFDETTARNIGICAKKIYSFLYNNPTRAWTKVQIGAITGYSPTSGGFNNAVSQLNSLGLISRNGNALVWRFTDDRFLTDVEAYTPDIWLKKLGACERSIFDFLSHNGSTIFSKEEIGAATKYSPTSGGFNNAISHLNSIGLVRRVSGGLQLNPELLEL